MNDAPPMSERRRRRYAFALALSAAAVIAYVYARGVELPNLAEREALHARIIENEARSPYNYRVLVPFLVEGIARAADELGASPKLARAAAYSLVDFVALALFFFATYRFLTRIHPHGRSLIGLTTIAALLPLSLRDHYYQPWSLVEMAIFAEAFTAAYDRNYWSMLALTLVGSLNRATGVYVPVIYFLGGVEWSDMRQRFFLRNVWHLAMVGVGVVGSAGVALGLRWLRGAKPSVHDPANLLAINLEPVFLAQAALHLLLFGGALWFAAWRARNMAHPFFKRMAWLVPLYGVPVLVFGVWKEVRLLAPLYPILVGFAIYWLKEFLPEPERANRVQP